MSAARRRVRRPIPRGEHPKAGLALIKVMISGVVLTIILSQRCAEESRNGETLTTTQTTQSSAQSGDTPGASTESSWIRGLIIPSELELPKSVLDRADREAPSPAQPPATHLPDSPYLVRQPSGSPAAPQ